MKDQVILAIHGEGEQEREMEVVEEQDQDQDEDSEKETNRAVADMRAVILDTDFSMEDDDSKEQ
ncbi:hypothetical protein RR48_06472 [Papilio machaon]|uniref:Uncharacterized protein n=1 Tax=Papilio machaon TaxID=76193 RepID=A0A194RQ46_PAPMA|nr:hypothetical protein RR48_06472 [Papilio machaon]